MTAATTIFKSFDLKELDATGTFEAIVSTATVDRDGDLIESSAFATETHKDVPLLQGHNWSGPALGKGRVSVSSRGALFKGEFFLKTGAGRDAFEVAKAMGASQQFSVGFVPGETAMETRDGQRVRVIKSLELVEVSLVVAGSNRFTTLTDIKAAPRQDLDTLDRYYRDHFNDLDDEMSVKALAKRGYDVEQGWLTHKGTALYPAAVSEAPTENDREIVHVLRKEFRVTASPEYAAAFWKLMKYVPGLGKDAVNALFQPEKKALSEGLDGAGGFLVPSEFRAQIEAFRAQTAVIRRFATIIPTVSDNLVLPMAAPHASAPNDYSSQLVGDWYGENPAGWTSVDPAFQRFSAAVRKLRTPLTVSAALWSDAPALAAFIASDGGTNLALVEDYGFISGNGLALQPTGLLNSGVTASDVEGSDANTISNSVSNAGSAPKLIDLVTSLPSQYRENARWLMRGSVEGKIRKLVGADGNWQFPRTDGLQLQGYPVHYSDAMPADGVDGAQVAVFGALDSYLIADRLSLSIQILQERFAEFDQIAILLKSRAGGGLYRSNGVVLGSV